MLAIGVASVATFMRAVPYPFMRSWDDARFIADNPDVHTVSWGAFVRMWTSVQFEAYHPLHLLSYWLDVPWSGANPAVVHAVSLALWVCGLWLVYFWLRALSVQPWAAVLCTLLFGLHPAQIEVVSWATGRKDVLALLFCAASLLGNARARDPWDFAAWFGRIAYLLAILCKTTALPLPLFALAIDVLVRGVPARQAALRQLPSALIAAAISGVVVWIWREHAMLRTNLGGPALALLRASQTLGHQLGTALWPSSTAPMYSTHDVARVDALRTVLAGLYLAACVLALRTRNGLLGAGLIGFGVWLAPASNLVPMYFPLQDRYVSLPLLGLALALAGALPARPHFLAWVVLLGLMARTWQYAGEWQSDQQLWGHAASTQPDAEYAWLKLGEVRRDAGALDGAIDAYREAVHVAPLRKLAHAALFEAVARRDERHMKAASSRARELAKIYYERLDQPGALRDLVGQLWSHGYLRSAELPMQALLRHEPKSDVMLAHAAQTALRERQRGVARFYVHAMRTPPHDGPLRDLFAEPYFQVVP